MEKSYYDGFSLQKLCYVLVFHVFCVQQIIILFNLFNSQVVRLLGSRILLNLHFKVAVNMMDLALQLSNLILISASQRLHFQ
jgi:hypothetical protein